MDQQPQQNHQTPNDNITTIQDMNSNTNTNSNKAASGNNGNGNNGGFLCRQSSTRWTPTTDQIRILKELYYNNGVRSPTAEQIQRISARLRQYGKIEGKNVFYWFQNHKARERQKKRFTSDHHHSHNHHHNHNITMQRHNTTTTPPPPPWKPDNHHHQDYQPFHHVVSCGMSSSSSASVFGVNGQMGNNCQYGYGGVTNMEKAFRDCGSSGVNGGSMTQNVGWVGSADPYMSSYSLFDKRSIALEDDDDGDQDEHDDHDEDQASPEIETLSLFPMHGEDVHVDGGSYGNMIEPNFANSGVGSYYSGWYRSDDGSGGSHVSSRTSLELSLNSYGHRSPDSL